MSFIGFTVIFLSLTLMSALKISHQCCLKGLLREKQLALSSFVSFCFNLKEIGHKYGFLKC